MPVLILLVIVLSSSVAGVYVVIRSLKADDSETKDKASRPPVQSPLVKYVPPARGGTKEVGPYPMSRVALSADRAELDVEQALRRLPEQRYFVFRDLIIPSPYKDLALTQIDHVVVSRHGIFCIETKSHHGDVYGYSRSQQWKQYIGGKEFGLGSPFRQNRHHVRALEALLRHNLRAPIHSYIAFPNAHKVVVDGAIEDMTPYGVVRKIAKHTQVVYDPDAIERIAKTLAHAATFREVLRDKHADQVRAYLEAKVSSRLSS